RVGISQGALAAIGNPGSGDLVRVDRIVLCEVDRPDDSLDTHVFGPLVDPDLLLAPDQQVAVGQYPHDGRSHETGQTVALCAVAFAVELAGVVDVVAQHRGSVNSDRATEQRHAGQCLVGIFRSRGRRALLGCGRLVESDGHDIAYVPRNRILE